MHAAPRLKNETRAKTCGAELLRTFINRSEFIKWLSKQCFVTIHPMQSFGTNNDEVEHAGETRQSIRAGNAQDLPPGTRKTVELPEGRELALFNVDGEFYAIDNICPHKGAPLAEGTLCEHVLECEWHGWQFDVRTGDCLTVTEKIQTFEVVVENGAIRILFGE